MATGAVGGPDCISIYNIIYYRKIYYYNILKTNVQSGFGQIFCNNAIPIKYKIVYNGAVFVCHSIVILLYLRIIFLTQHVIDKFSEPESINLTVECSIYRHLLQ